MIRSYTIEWKEFFMCGEKRRIFISDMRGENKQEILRVFKKDNPDSFSVRIRVNKEVTEQLKKDRLLEQYEIKCLYN